MNKRSKKLIAGITVGSVIFISGAAYVLSMNQSNEAKKPKTEQVDEKQNHKDLDQDKKKNPKLSKKENEALNDILASNSVVNKNHNKRLSSDENDLLKLILKEGNNPVVLASKPPEEKLPEVTPPKGNDNETIKPIIPLPPVFINTKPIISLNQSSIVIGINGEFNPYDYVTAYDKEDGDLTSNVLVEGEVDTSESGVFSVVYSVTDSHGAMDTKVLTVIVNSAPSIIVSSRIPIVQIDTAFNPLDYVSASDFEDGDLTANITYESTVDTSKEGTYQVTYTVSDQYGFTVSATLRVLVENEAPIIHANDRVVQIHSAALSKEDILAQVTATDREDGDLSSAVTLNEKQLSSVDFNKEGNYDITLSVSDKHGKVTNKVITIRVTNEAPKFSGLENKTIDLGTQFDALENVSAIDREDGNITSDIQVSGSVDTNKLGDYVLTYSVTDKDGKKTTKNITVSVVNALPVLTGANDKTVALGADFDPLEGVVATSKTEGDLTSKIKVDGTVDTSKAGKNILTYSVQDNRGVKTTKQVTITVK